MPFQPGNTEGSKSHSRAKPMRDAMRMEMAAIENGEDCVAPRGSLRWIARQQFLKAGEDTSAFKEIADRLDGKVPQGHGGDDDLPAIRVRQTIERVIVDPKPDTDSEGIPPAA